jgi:hypothetical protein
MPAEAEIGIERSFHNEDGEFSTHNGSTYNKKPSSTFRLSYEDPENGTSLRDPRGRWGRWTNMGTRERKTYSPPEDQSEAEEEIEGLLNGEHASNTQGTTTAERRVWHYRCLRGGNTALTIV